MKLNYVKHKWKILYVVGIIISGAFLFNRYLIYESLPEKGIYTVGKVNNEYTVVKRNNIVQHYDIRYVYSADNKVYSKRESVSKEPMFSRINIIYYPKNPNIHIIEEAGMRSRDYGTVGGVGMVLFGIGIIWSLSFIDNKYEDYKEAKRRSNCKKGG